MQGKKDYQEKLFIRFQLSDYVPADNFYRRLKSILDLNFVYDTTSKYYGTEGQKSIDPVVFFKLMLVGYLENLNSDRRIIATSRMRMDILYFIGYDLDEELPWHSTLSRTRQLYGEEEFTAVFKQVLKKCIDAGLVAGKRQAIDSAFVKANAAMSSLVEREIMNDAATYGKQLDDHNDEAPAGDIPDENTKPKPRKNAKVDKKANSKRYSPSDPDARLSVKPGKTTRLNYSAHVSVDTQNHVITHIQAFHADKGDAPCLPEILTHVAGNLKDNGMEIEDVLADTGYSGEAALLFLAGNHIKGFIPNRPGCQSRESRQGFSYDGEQDRYVCPEGKYLTFHNFKKAENDNTHKIYRTSVKDCRDCPLKSTCANLQGFKVFKDSVAKDLYIEMHERMQTRQGSKARKVRQSTVEPVLGTLINFTGMKQVNTKGLELANKCMIMAAIAYNLKKLVNGIPAKIRRRKRKLPGNHSDAVINTLSACLLKIANILTAFSIDYKSKWPNNHLLCNLIIQPF
ncbi:IS1182 family transposase [Mucilaginibacter rubeus]|uniref:IS1182 family transposase n=3 Tax=Mucilaginibacter rubeus TaxID=2027860 RepID=A0AAE6MIJ3_9SPHI|nr:MULTISPECIES: IS1182 family transposase [Mucilaginibacter]QEM02404.1 IS1182 family transposase [Mucilaginibacter rubeus]QEM02657.1 IS1182 family transposase [Mucilaginibacter rubeus]QEM02974.1 IS1182 family transposase [Mucilaginibacter rubeus]QEM03163.1 IS1182 family transposase [Mucilaginibacter rubeus]QEM04835.1 IS1182 family transposase [Mucilaginibacter rubeus]